MLLLIFDVFVNVNTVKIMQYSRNDTIVFNYDGREYLLICEENADKFPKDLYENYQSYLPIDYERVENTVFKKCISMGAVYIHIYFHIK